MTSERWYRIEELFHAALELDPSDRSSFLLQQCADDEGLLREVESLLASHERTGRFYEEGASALAADWINVSFTPLYPGDSLGHYQLQSLLGAGGMGQVFLATDKRLGRNVALKILPRDLSWDQGRLCRFIREAKMAAILNHPNVATIYDVGEQQGVHFIVMEYVEGETLAHRLQRGSLRWQETVEIGIQVADALDAAHDKGIIHRDIKAENVMIADRGQIKVLDFGLAKMHRGNEAHRPQHTLITRPGMVLGTIETMSPEQVLGRELDARTDIFSLGVMLYEMIAGQLPFSGSTPTETMGRILHEHPRPIERKKFDLPLQLEAIIKKCLEKKPDRRYTTARLLGHDLGALKAGLAPDRSVVSPLRKMLHRYRARGQHLPSRIFIAAVLGVAGLILYTYVFMLGPSQTPEIESLAVLPLRNLSGLPDQEYFSDGITESLISELARSQDLRIISRTSVMRYKQASQPLPEIARELNVDAVLEGSVMRHGDRVRVTAQLVHAATDRHLWSDSYERHVRDVLALQQELAQAIAVEVQGQVTAQRDGRQGQAAPVDPLAYENYLKGRYHWNRRTLEGLYKAIEHFEEAIRLEPGYALAYVGLADSYNLLTPYGSIPPQESYPKARQAAQRALDISDDLAEAYASLAVVQHEYEWNWREAERNYQRAVQLNPNYAPARQWYAEFLTRQKRYQEALAEIEQARRLDPLSLIINAIVGWVLHYSGDHQEAIDHLRKALELDPDFPLIHNYLGLAYGELGMNESSIASHGRAVALSGRNPRYLFSLGVAHAKAGNRRQALAILEQLLERSRTVYVPAFQIASLYTALHDNQRAFEWLDKAVQERGVWMLFLRMDPLFDSLRHEPRFAALIKQVSFPSRASHIPTFSHPD